MGYLAKQHIKIGSRTIAPGEAIPIEKGRDYVGMVARGTAIFVPDLPPVQVHVEVVPVNLDAIAAVFATEAEQAQAQQAPAEHIVWLEGLRDRVLAAGAEEDLDSLSRTKLDALALQRGVEAPEKFPNKAALIAKIRDVGS